MKKSSEWINFMFHTSNLVNESYSVLSIGEQKLTKEWGASLCSGDEKVSLDGAPVASFGDANRSGGAPDAAFGDANAAGGASLAAFGAPNGVENASLIVEMCSFDSKRCSFKPA